MYIYIHASGSAILVFVQTFSKVTTLKLSKACCMNGESFNRDDDDDYLDKLQTRGVKKSILYM
jgi:hypothetical protein